MSSTSETGHSKNVTNLETLITFATSYGAAYNPSKPTIKLPALTTLLTTAKGSVTAVNTALAPLGNAIAAREVAFDPFQKLITRVKSAVMASDITEQVGDNVKTIANKLQGRRATPKLTETLKAALQAKGEKVQKQISASQQGFDDLVDNFEKLLKLLTSIPQYAPNENELKVATLTTLYNDLRTKNSAVVTALATLNNARIARNAVLYKPTTGLVDLALSVKEYIKSVYGASSPQFKQVNSISFKNLNDD